MSSKEQISLRLPSELLSVLNDLSEERDVTRTELVISLLWDALGGNEKPKNATQKTATKITKVYPKMSPSFQQHAQQPDLEKLIHVIEVSTLKQSELIGQISELIAKQSEKDTVAANADSRTKAKTKAEPSNASSSKRASRKGGGSQSKTKSKTTKRGGKPAPLYLYKGKEATLREHLRAALPQLDGKQLDRARNNINRKVKGRTDKKSTNRRTPAEAITHEIERWRKKLETSEQE